MTFDDGKTVFVEFLRLYQRAQVGFSSVCEVFESLVMGFDGFDGFQISWWLWRLLFWCIGVIFFVQKPTKISFLNCMRRLEVAPAFLALACLPDSRKECTKVLSWLRIPIWAGARVRQINKSLNCNQRMICTSMTTSTITTTAHNLQMTTMVQLRRWVLLMKVHSKC